MGAGIFGLSLAWEMTRRGAPVQVIEAAAPGAAASGGLVGALQPHVPENWNAKKALQLESLLMAESWWRDVAAASGLSPGYARTGRLQPLADEAAVERARARAAEAAHLWQGQAAWRLVPAAERGPWAPPSPTGWCVFDDLSARLHPRQALASLCAALAAKGVRVETGSHPPEGAQGPVVWATGAAGLLANGWGGAVKGQAAALLYAAPPGAPQIFAEELHLVPHEDGTLAIGSTSEREWDRPDETDAALETLIAKARRLMPVLATAPVVARWAGLRPRAASRAPLLGPWPGRPGHYVLNGGFKIGYGMAPKLATLLADLLLEGQDAIPPEFHPPA